MIKYIREDEKADLAKPNKPNKNNMDKIYIQDIEVTEDEAQLAESLGLEEYLYEENEK